jgi:hypothetical protein
MKDDIFADLDHAHRRRGCFSLRNLGCFVLLMILAVIAVLLGIIAETGLVRIPVLSNALYSTPPGPLRAVEPTGQASIESMLQSKEKDLVGLAVGAQPQITVTESELTQLAREPWVNGQVPIKQAQVTIEPTYVELFGLITIPVTDSTAVVRARLIPVASQPTQLQLSEIRIGYVRVPINIAKAIIHSATGITPDSISVGQFGIQGLNLGGGTVMLELDRAKLKLPTGQAEPQ